MKISYQWLKEYISLEVTADELAHKLTMAGLEVENIHYNNGDAVLEIEVTPNRPDCLNMLGIAREVSAIFDREKIFPEPKGISFPTEKVDINIQDPEDCARYIGTVIRDVVIKKAEGPLIEKLAAIGMRSINNIVDITNFCLIETGQPLHAFDYDKLIGGRVIVRRARQGEKIITIDDVERELDPSILIIADEKRPVAIAGIMGGKETEVSSSTKNILLESAYFDPILIRRASRKLALASDSSYRFERGVDFDDVKSGAQRAISLILNSAEGKITQYTDLKQKEKNNIPIEFQMDISDINAFLGSSLASQKCCGLLRRLDFNVTDNEGKLCISPPGFRGDIKREVDVMEEIARVIGYDQLPYSVPEISRVNIKTNPERKAREAVRDILIAQGFNEVISYTMLNRNDLKKCCQEDLQGITIVNPLSVDQEILRPSFLPSMLAIAQFNINRAEKNLKIFETGKIYVSGKEIEKIALLMTGLREKDWRQNKTEDVDFFDMKGALEQLFERSRIKTVNFVKDTLPFFEDNENASIYLEGKPAGIFGRVSQKILDDWNIKQKGLYFAEIDLELLYKERRPSERFQPLSEYPSVIWDISLAVNQHISFQEVKEIAEELGGGILQRVQFKEEYTGDKIPQGKRGLVFSLVYQSSEKTLTEAEVSLVHNAISEALIEKLGAVKR